VVWNIPVAVVVRQAVAPELEKRLLAVPIPPVAVAKALAQLLGATENPVLVMNQDTVLAPTFDVICMKALLANPSPVMVMDEPTVPDVAAV
jgi:hypothetical protein